MAGKRRVRIKGRFYVIMASFLALLVWGVSSLASFLNPPEIEWGRLSTDQSADALVLRQEQILRTAGYARLEPVAPEGSRVEAGEEAAVIYLSGYSQKDLASLISLQQTIKDYQTNNILKSVVDSGLNELENEVSAKLDEISVAMDEGAYDRLPILEGELAEIMERRRVYMNTTITADSHLTTLYQQETDLQTRIDANKSTLLSPGPGLLSYMIDGYEEVLRADLLQEFTASGIAGILENIASTGVSASALVQSSGEVPVFRIVQETPWYLLMVVPKTDNTLTKGGNCEVTIEGCGEDSLSAYVVDVRMEKRQDLVILEMQASVGPLLSLRRVSVHIGRSAEGWKVPVDQVGVRDGTAYIVLKIAGQETEVPVNVLAQDAQSVILESGDEGVSLTAGMRLYEP